MHWEFVLRSVQAIKTEGPKLHDIELAQDSSALEEFLADADELPASQAESREDVDGEP